MAKGESPGKGADSTTNLGFEATALRGIEAGFGPERADTFRRDLRTDFSKN